MGLKGFGFLSKPKQGSGGKAVLTGWLHIGPRRERIMVFPNTYNTRGEGQGMSYILMGDDGRPQQQNQNQQQNQQQNRPANQSGGDQDRSNESDDFAPSGGGNSNTESWE